MGALDLSVLCVGAGATTDTLIACLAAQGLEVERCPAERVETMAQAVACELVLVVEDGTAEAGATVVERLSRERATASIPVLVMRMATAAAGYEDLENEHVAHWVLDDSESWLSKLMTLVARIEAGEHRLRPLQALVDSATPAPKLEVDEPAGVASRPRKRVGARTFVGMPPLAAGPLLSGLSHPPRPIVTGHHPVGHTQARGSIAPALRPRSTTPPAPLHVVNQLMARHGLQPIGLPNASLPPPPAPAGVMFAAGASLPPQTAANQDAPHAPHALTLQDGWVAGDHNGAPSVISSSVIPEETPTYRPSDDAQGDAPVDAPRSNATASPEAQRHGCDTPLNWSVEVEMVDEALASGTRWRFALPALPALPALLALARQGAKPWLYAAVGTSLASALVFAAYRVSHPTGPLTTAASQGTHAPASAPAHASPSTHSKGVAPMATAASNASAAPRARVEPSTVAAIPADANDSPPPARPGRAELARASREVLRGHALLRRKQRVAARAAYSAALNAVPDYPAAIAGLVRVYLLEENASEALRWAQRLVAQRPNSATSQLLLGDAWALSSELPPARDAWGRAAASGNRSARRRLASTEMR